MPDLAPEAIAQQSFRSAFRGYHPEEVRAFLRELSERLAAIVEERDRLLAQLDMGAGDDLEHEIDVVSKEIGSVLQTARAVADSMRERASAEAARWRSEALAEAEKTRREAQADAEHLRTDAWTTAESLLTEVQREASRIKAEAEKEAMRLVGESEREAHRTTGAGRREAEDVVRVARMEAERLVLSAQARHGEIIDSANKQAEVAQERTRALEERRDELRRELDSVRAALSSVEGELDERREALGLTPPPPEPEAETKRHTWEPGETVRVVRPGSERPTGEAATVAGSRQAPDPTPELRVLTPQELRKRREAEASGSSPTEERIVDVAAELLDQTPASPLAEPDATDSEPTAIGAEPDAAEPEPESSEPDVETAAEPVEPTEPKESIDPSTEPAHAAVDETPEPEAEQEPQPTRVEPAVLEERPVQQSFDALEGLFARLRQPVGPDVAGAPAEQPAHAAAGADKHEPVTEPAAAAPPTLTLDPFELRDRLLLPISNRALRNLKRQLTEEQNAALEGVRLDDAGWMPDPDAVQSSLRADLVVLAAESFAAGHAAAEEMTGRRLTRPPTPKDDVVSGFASDLAHDLDHVLRDGRQHGHGSRQLGSELSRVFRAWRTDESERRLRDLSFQAYNQGIAQSLAGDGGDLHWSVAGRGCAVCRDLGGRASVEEIPPAHDGCGCTVVPA